MASTFDEDPCAVAVKSESFIDIESGISHKNICDTVMLPLLTITKDYSVSWDEFKASIKYITTISDDQLDDLHILGGLVNKENKVTTEKFQRFMRIFLLTYKSTDTGFTYSDLLNAINAFVAGFVPGAFVGNLRRKDVTEMMESRTDDTFVIRLSESSPCNIVVSICKAKKTEHYLIPLSKEKDKALVFFGGTYRNLAHLVASSPELANPCSELVMQSYSLGVAMECFHGFITYEETCARLKGKTAGSYLIRKSASYDNTFIVAFIANDSKVYQSMIEQISHPSSKEAVKCSERIYSSISSLITSCCEILKNPVSNKVTTVYLKE